MMITYHCFHIANYDQSFDININRYLGYVSGSFPFMAGYFVSAYYFESFKEQSILIFKRLFIRGIKLILIYITLNLIFIYVVNNHIDLNVTTKSDTPIISILVGDPPRVIYDILYSIGIILIFGATLSVIHEKIISRSNQYTLVILMSLLSIMLYINGSILIASGIMGIIAGISPIRKHLEKIYSNGYIIIISYLFGLLAAILIDHIRQEMLIYLLCITTLFFSLKHSYTYLKLHIDKSNIIHLFSRYSLFIYLFHVPVLVLYSKMFLWTFPAIEPLLLFAILISLTAYSSILATQVIEIAHKNKNGLHTVYKSIFN